MSTAHSSSRALALWADAGTAVRDVGPLLQFRAAGLRGRARRGAALGLTLIFTLTVLVAWLPAYLSSWGSRRDDIFLLLPSGYLAVLVVAIVSAAASGGGRELLSRDEGVAFAVSPATDHLGALLMAPLNIAWLLQAWTLLGATAYVVGPGPGLLLAQAPVLAWLVAATALAQVLAWTVEWVRRGPHGAVFVRILVVALGGGFTALIVTHKMVPLLNHSPTLLIARGVLYGASGSLLPWALMLVVVLVIGLTATVAGAFVARAVTRRPAREELHVESAVRAPRRNPASDLAALIRTDRVGIWRSVPMRRGLAVLALLPGFVALAGALEWDMLSVLPGLVASGGALLFGVNSWCLDGRGALWRDSLPVSPRLAFGSRVLVLCEVLFVAICLTLTLASLRAGLPTVSQAVAVLCAAVVVSLQVVATSLRWSVRRPFGVDMRSARAAPAPPLVMVGYSSRLAVTTTLTALVFTALSNAPWQWSPVFALPFLLFSACKLVATSRQWADPEVRAKVVATVAS